MPGEEHVQKHSSQGDKAGPTLGAGGTKMKRHVPYPPGAYSLVGKVYQYKAILVKSGEYNGDFRVTHRDNMPFPAQLPEYLPVIESLG